MQLEDRDLEERGDAKRRDDAERIAALARDAVDRATAARAEATHLPTEIVELDELDLAIAAAIAQRAMQEVERRTGALLDQLDAAVATLHAARLEPARAPDRATVSAAVDAATGELRRWVDTRLDDVIRAVDARLREITAEAHDVARTVATESARATAAEAAQAAATEAPAAATQAAPAAAAAPSASSPPVFRPFRPPTASARALMASSVRQAVDLLVAGVEAGQLDEATAAREIAELESRLVRP